MQRMVLLLVVPLVLRAELGLTPPGEAVDWRGPAGFLAGYIVLAGLVWALARAVAGVLADRQHAARRAMRWWYRLIRAAQAATLVNFYLALFVLGVVEWAVGATGMPVFVVEMAMLLPPLGMFVFLWWAGWPIEWQMHRMSLLREIDAGRPVYPMPRRGAFVWFQVRHQLLIWLVPMLGIVGVVEAITAAGAHWRWASPITTALIALAAVGLFALTPVMIRVVWDTVPMPDGPLRRRLWRLCERERVGVADLLIWRTMGGMINGAVIGVLPRLRYVLLTDGLLERMSEKQTEAVMAHELAHVRRRHLPWLGVAALATLGAVMTAVDLALVGLRRAGLPVNPLNLATTGGLTADPVYPPPGEAARQAGEAVANLDGAWGGLGAGLGLLVALGIWFVVFGFISRRFERQADAFAVQHFTRRPLEAPEDVTMDAHAAEPQPDETHPRITHQAVQAIAGALESLATLNHLSPEQPNWRHGSIRWRCDYLRSLVGRPVDDLPIDRQVRWINWGCLALLTAVLWIEWQVYGGAMG